MPKLNNRPPKYSKLGKYAVVYYGGKSHYLGRYGSDESKIAYSRLLAEIQASPTGVPVPKEERHVTVRELALTMRQQRTSACSRRRGRSNVAIFTADFAGNGHRATADRLPTERNLQDEGWRH